tara:strand:- start:3722 stop:3970 length:249 start_codon:yes stop_codon:yes gene_type:complete
MNNDSVVGIEGMTFNTETTTKFVNQSLRLMTTPSPVISYNKATTIASGFIRADEFDNIVMPANMAGAPHHDSGINKRITKHH